MVSRSAWPVGGASCGLAASTFEASRVNSYVVLRRRVDEPAVAGGVAVDQDRLADLFAQQIARQVGDLERDACQDLAAGDRSQPPDRFVDNRRQFRLALQDRVARQGLQEPVLRSG